MISSCNGIKKGFDTEPLYNEKHLKNKVESYEGKSIQFYDNRMPKKVLIVFVYWEY